MYLQLHPWDPPSCCDPPPEGVSQPPAHNDDDISFGYVALLLVKEFKNATSLLFEESTIKFSKWRKCFLIWRWISGLHHCISRNAKMRCNSKVSIPCFKSCPLYKKKDCSWNTHTWQRKSQKPLSVCCSLLALKFKTFQFTFQSVGVPSAQQKPLPGCLTEWGEKP